MQAIIVGTDFSTAAQTALDYTCALLADKATSTAAAILLVHAYSVPAGYTNDGVSFAAVQEALTFAEERLSAIAVKAKQQYPSLLIHTHLESGGLRQCLEKLILAQRPAAVVMGAGPYDNIWAWGAETLAALRDLAIPMLVVPGHLRYHGLNSIGYACNCKNISHKTPLHWIRALIQLTNTTLQIIHIETPEVARQHPLGKGVDLLRSALSDIPMHYHHVTHPSFIEGLATFLEAHQIDLLLITPRQYGTWASLFRKSNTKAIARLNRLPVLALREANS